MREQQITAETLDYTRREIARLVAEIKTLAAQDIPPGQFFQEFLRRVNTALAAQAVALWLPNAAGQLQPVSHVNLRTVGLDQPAAQASHEELLKQIAENNKPNLIGPYSSTGDDKEVFQVTNPTGYLLVVTPIPIENNSVGVVEVFQDPGRSNTAQRGYLQFLVQVVAEASHYFRNHQFRKLATEQKLWNHIENFVRTVHGGLNAKQVAYLLANEGRKLIKSERVSVAVRRGNKTVIEAISGQETVERKSNLVRRMAAVADRVLQHGENLIYNGAIDDQWPRDVVIALERYLAESGSKILAIIPMPDTREFGVRGKASAALVVEM
ncbi:MAG: hypothetical protein ACRDD1_06755, partial [Planctomycetia bacterium]